MAFEGAPSKKSALIGVLGMGCRVLEEDMLGLKAEPKPHILPQRLTPTPYTQNPASI